MGRQQKYAVQKQLSDGNLTYNKLAPNWVNFIPTYLSGGVLVSTFVQVDSTSRPVYSETLT